MEGSISAGKTDEALRFDEYSENVVYLGDGPDLLALHLQSKMSSHERSQGRPDVGIGT